MNKREGENKVDGHTGEKNSTAIKSLASMALGKVSLLRSRTSEGEEASSSEDRANPHNSVRARNPKTRKRGRGPCMVL